MFYDGLPGGKEQMPGKKPEEGRGKRRIAFPTGGKRRSPFAAGGKDPTLPCGCDRGIPGGISAGVMGKFVPTSSVINSVSKTANKINSQGIDYFLDFGVKVSNKLTQNGVSASNLNSYFVNPYLNLGIGVEKVATNIGRYSYVYGSILSNNMSSGGSSLLSVGYSWMSWTK